jgi:hypothetical protein
MILASYVPEITLINKYRGPTLVSYYYYVGCLMTLGYPALIALFYLGILFWDFIGKVIHTYVNLDLDLKKSQLVVIFITKPSSECVFFWG